MDFPIGDSGQVIRLGGAVLKKLVRHRQRLFWQPESGGQLFARLAGSLIDIVEATGPRVTDRRGRYHYHPDKVAEQREIDCRFAQGLHFVGDWHTHAQALPEPSWTDLDSMMTMVQRSRHEMNGFVLVIVGTAKLPGGLYLAVHDGLVAHRLPPSSLTQGEVPGG
jgi:integrative and conjugative element protein (TIGR02256 family)